jgi:hypothetical protein
MQHDISHCKGGECPLKDTCYRYLAYKELKENPGKYGQYHSYFITTPFNYGKCKHYMKAENDCH